jgi:hypothetical protein
MKSTVGKGARQLPSGGNDNPRQQAGDRRGIGLAFVSRAYLGGGGGGTVLAGLCGAGRTLAGGAGCGRIFVAGAGGGRTFVGATGVGRTFVGAAGGGRTFVGATGVGNTFVGGTACGVTFAGGTACGTAFTVSNCRLPLAGGGGVWAWAVAERQAAAARKPKSRRSFMGVVSKRSDILPNRDPAGPARPPSATVCTSILDARDCILWVIWDFFAFD